MKVKQVKYAIEDNKISFKCPLCNAVLMTNVEAKYEHNKCKHLRFVWYFDGSIDYIGNWDTDTFEKEIRNRYIEMCDPEDREKIENMNIENLFPFDLEKFFSSFKSPDIDEVLWYFELERIAIFRVLWGIKQQQED